MDCPHCGKQLPIGVRYVFAKHGHSGSLVVQRSPTYRSWQNMIGRCTQPSSPSYRHYKRLGITVCKRWRKFENFLADMGERPDNTSLDRIDTTRNYEPGNCRWATKREQSNNRSDNRRFMYKGGEYTLADLARLTGADYGLLHSRLCRSTHLKWTVEGAVETPPLTRAQQGFYR